MSGALTWHAAGAVWAANLGRDRARSIGRADGADVRIDDSSVSREQAAIRFDGTAFRIANQSRTNPTRVNGERAEAEIALRDGDELLMGAVKLRFHDLGVHDTISGPICSHCGRENNTIDRDCWYCGTSLVTAASVLRKRRHVIGRLVADDGQFLDLYEGQSATLTGGPPAVRQQGGDAKAGMEVTASESGLSATQAEGAERQLQTGDVLEAGGTRYAVIVRA